MYIRKARPGTISVYEDIVPGRAFLYRSNLLLARNKSMNYHKYDVEIQKYYDPNNRIN